MKRNYFNFVLPFLFLLLVNQTITAQTSITFHINDLRAGPANCNWMFETDTPNFKTHDENALTNGGDVIYDNFAYRRFTWSDDSSSGTCSAENMVVLGGINNVTLKLYNFDLKSFHHINTVNANNNWAVDGEAGDERVYAGGIGEIYVNGVPKLKVINCRLSVQVPYPTAAQMNAILGGNVFTSDIGSGQATTGSGWGVIDAANSDAGWVAELDPNGTGQLKYDLSTISAVIQGAYGYYDFDITVQPTTHQEIMNFENVIIGGFAKSGSSGSGVTALTDSDVSFNFSAGVNGNGDMNTVYANKITTDPGGSLPSGIERISSQYYWELGTTFNTFTVEVTFDISTLQGVSNTSALRILKRNNSSADWAVYNDFTLVDANHIKANNVTSFSQFAIGSTGGNPLPVELISFSAKIWNERVLLEWETASEINNYGFEIQRSVNGSQSSENSYSVIGFVPGNGNSNSAKHYEFIDSNAPVDKLQYRLKQIDTDGSFEYYGTIAEVDLGVTGVKNPAAAGLPTEFALIQNYPNPFNPTTTIKYTIPSVETPYMASLRTVLKVYDMLGREVATLVNEEQQPGYYEVRFDGSKLASGIYLYKLQSGSFSSTKKLMLLK